MASWVLEIREDIAAYEQEAAYVKGLIADCDNGRCIIDKPRAREIFFRFDGGRWFLRQDRYFGSYVDSHSGGCFNGRYYGRLRPGSMRLPVLAEELNTLVHMETVVSNEEVRRTVVWTLRHIHNVNLFVVLLVVVFPSVYEMGVHRQMPALSGKTMLLFLLIGLIVMLIFNQLCTHSLLVELAGTRDDGRSVMPCSSRQNSSEYIPTIPPVQFPPVESARGRRYEQEDDADADPFNVESSERVFNDVYGCESYEDPDVHAVDNKQAFRVISVAVDKVTVSFTDTIEVHRRSSCLRGTVYSSGVPIRPLGSRPPACETDSDGDGVGYRRTVGLLIEWRRCYMLNMVINALLVVSILDMTSVLDPWWSAL
ncbi:hypothetical protein T484DRAFT_1757164 [Baffinella frigidus]|nr:hypothetical protein T484DRAFT_1757164 [Cryptophyta sp. CCMP2293]